MSGFGSFIEDKLLSTNLRTINKEDNLDLYLDPIRATKHSDDYIIVYPVKLPINEGMLQIFETLKLYVGHVIEYYKNTNVTLEAPSTLATALCKLVGFSLEHLDLSE